VAEATIARNTVKVKSPEHRGVPPGSEMCRPGDK
jgi:hypothetical protein